MSITEKKQPDDDQDYSIEKTTILPDQTMSQTIGQLALALSKAQGMIHGAKKDSKNPFFKSSYADLAAVIEAAREPLAKNGLAVIQTTTDTISGVTVITTLCHESGEWIRGTLHMTPVKSDPQGIGSCMTYARRYSYAAMIGIAQVDDDANEASEISETKTTKKITEKITEQQALELHAMITDNDLDIGAIYKWIRTNYKCNGLENLTTDAYQIVKKQIQEKINRNATHNPTK